MNDTSPSLSNGTDKSLDGQAVLTAVATVCGHDRPAAALLKKVFKRLVCSDDWATAVSRLERFDLYLRHFTGTMADVFDIPGDLILMRDAEGGFTLLHQMEQRWQYLAKDGSPLSEEVTAEGEDRVEAVVLKRPESLDKSGGFASLAALWPELRAAWAEVGISSLYINSGQLALSMFSMLVYDKIALNGLYETLWALVIGMGIYMVTNSAMRMMRCWATERISVNLTLRSDEKLWSKLVAQSDLPPGGFGRFLTHYRDLTLSRDFVSSSYLLAIADSPFLLVFLAVIGLIAWPLMVVTIILAVLFTFVGYLLQSRQIKLSKEAELKNAHKLSFMGETLWCLDIVRTTPGSGAFLRRWRNLVEQSTFCETKRRFVLFNVGILSSVTQTVTTVVNLTVGVYLIQAHDLTIGKLIACNILANRAMGLVSSLFAVTAKYQDFMRASERLEQSLNEVTDKNCTPREDIVGNIEVIGLGKDFEGRPPALKAVSFSIAQGERIALLGRPGAGKSTLLKCLAGLSKPDAGQILIDGLALDDISRFDRVKWMAYKAQDPMLFAGSLEENLRISGCKESNRFGGAIWASGLENEFKSGRMSLGMSLDERGSNLSGGQRQKVALARAFAQSSRILLLDEPTLGLDPESERMLAERLPKLLDSSSVLVMTTHSSVMLKMVQRIIALDGGRMVADGPREKLVTLSPKNVSGL